MINFNEIIRISKIHPSRIEGCYLFGSRIYLTNNYNSDFDIILIAKNSVSNIEIKHPIYNIHIIVPSDFDKLLQDNNIKALEVFFAPEFAIIKKYPMNFTLKENSLRHSISHYSSNSYVKAKKKIQQGDYYIGIKSLFHSIRMVDFGIQISKNKSINFQSCNHIWEDLNSKKWEWEELHNKYSIIRNQLLTEFRKINKK